MLKSKHILATSILLSSLFAANTVSAKASFQTLQPLSYNNAISCSSCHAGAPQTENNVTTSYGVAYDNYADDDIISSLSAAYITLEPFDSDGDGFTNLQEILAGSNLNVKALTPALILPDVNAGNVMAKAVDGGAVSTLSITGTSFNNDMVTFEKPTAATTTATFMYTFGGMQAAATASFYDESGVLITITPANTADVGYIANNTTDGSINITITDDGAFDLYSTPAFERAAMARTAAFTPVVNPELINLNATVDPYAIISPTATIDDYAVVDAYAIVDSYAVVGVYAQVGSYVYIAPNVDIYTGLVDTYATIDPYVSVTANITTPGFTSLPNPAGYVKARFSVTTSTPTPLLLGTTTGVGGDASGDSGGLHCMTTGLGTQALMFLGLLGLGLLVRRKIS